MEPHTAGGTKSAGDDQLSQVSLVRLRLEGAASMVRGQSWTGDRSRRCRQRSLFPRGTPRRTVQRGVALDLVVFQFLRMTLSAGFVGDQGDSVQRVPGHLGQHLLCA